MKNTNAVTTQDGRILIHGEAGVKSAGHREYVGGHWELIGKLQLDFLISQGLLPEHVFVDVACGSLRAGVWLIPYLNPGNYLGIEKEQSLIEAGLKEEIGGKKAKLLQPEFVISDSFEFEKFSKKPFYGIAQSLFTHLLPAQIDLCLAKLRAFIDPGMTFFCTIMEGDSKNNPPTPHDRLLFWYSKQEMNAFAQRHGWEMKWIGPWNHPRNQQMVRFIAR